MPERTGRAARVLIAEDDDSLRRLLELRLQADGFETESAADGIEAMTVVDRWVPDVVVCDVMMPRMSGLSVCRELRERDSTAEVPIILLTARCFDEDIQQVMGLGGIEYIGKPFDFMHLIATLRAMLGEVPSSEPRRIDLTLEGTRR
ncbi:MAG: response regulator [Candidatus Dormibacteraeota bacterium]|nr:response regulator [Candidatus Dormibacteraeota bacterium]